VIIIGVDPGTIVTGYGIIKVEGGVYHPIDYGCIRPPKDLKLTDRYLIIYNCVSELIDKYGPEVLIVESQYVHKNVQSAIKLGMSRGIIMLSAKQRKMPIYEYYPTKSKLAVVGTGKASKSQVQQMIKQLLNLSMIPPEDAADALALAICHAHSLNHPLHSQCEI
jgi:crossover junction endodeoxyribonuclease RuvC